eukprot:CAMPEP_0170086542 /NCGR_PEP_ID=MMETSP0019_2-20121128/21192_1 /TAXON_ID=98059 /ORGANISM="Dinobryon sp., Strain UTEXLB2267" /LENGTH=49 /DNA_ID=CAMNT_0010303641 /DNA_START=15 /DNA_END=164 /DNA_ORIENTATION=+
MTAAASPVTIPIAGFKVATTTNAMALDFMTVTPTSAALFSGSATSRRPS